MAQTGLSKDFSEGLNNELSASIQIIRTDWNDSFTKELELGALRIAEQFQTVKTDCLSVPGAVELGFAIRQHALKQKADAYIMFGCIIQGETPHFDYVCQAVTQACTILNQELDSPVIFGVLTCNNENEVQERLGGAHGHKGEEAMWTALKMISFQRAL